MRTLPASTDHDRLELAAPVADHTAPAVVHEDAMDELLVEIALPVDTDARISDFGELIEHERQVLDAASGGPEQMDSVLQGRTLDPWTAWETANRLGLPSEGPFVVVAAQAPAIGAVALPEIESKLRSLDVYSAWRVLPDLEIGIIHVKSDQQLEKVLALLSRTTAHRVGVSARIDGLCDVPQALHVAKVTLRGSADRDSRVVVFDGSILATAAVSAPAVMLKSARGVLEHFDDLGEEERELLFETFRVWQENDGSISATAEALVCHPNTVRYRLRRIEKRTGRSLSRPKDIAELCLVFEVQRRLI
jgi:PucR C-terminal helix-turn-helix domain/GGDEF-like domain